MKIHFETGRIGICALMLLTATLWGCSGEKPKNTLKGKVTYKNEAVADANVQIQTAASGAAAAAKTDAGGNYTIEAVLPPGKYSVWVIPFEVPPPAPPPPGYKPADNPKIPKKYRSAATSGLTLEVKAGANTFDIPMAD